MTFFLDQPAEPPKIKANNPDIDLADGWTDGLGAAISVSQLETDANFIGTRRTREAQASLGWDAAERLGADVIAERARQQGISEPIISAFTSLMGRRSTHMPDNLRSVITDLANEAASDDPEAWADMDLSDDAAFNQANESMREEYEDAQAILDMMPGGQGSARLLGGMIGMTADVKNIPFLMMGGGSGSFARVIGREAAINMGAEAAFMPSQFEMAERLDIPDPSVVTQLAIAAAAGGILGGAMEAGARGFTYWRGRNAVQPMRGYDEIKTHQLVDEVEDILTSDMPQPFRQIKELAEENPPTREVPSNKIAEDAIQIPEVGRISDELHDEIDAVLEDAIRKRSPLSEVDQRKVDEAYANNGPDSPEIAKLIEDGSVETPRDLVLYRGVVREDPEGDVPLSYTFSRDTAENFGTGKPESVEQIVVPAGTRVYSPRSGVSGGEVLIRPSAIEPDVPRTHPDSEAAIPTSEPTAMPAVREGSVAPNTPKRDSAASVEDSQIGPEAHTQRDVFSDPASPEAETIHQTVMDDMRTDIERDGASEINMVVDDGRVLKTDADVLAELDADQEFLEVMNLCGRAA